MRGTAEAPLSQRSMWSPSLHLPSPLAFVAVDNFVKFSAFVAVDLCLQQVQGPGLGGREQQRWCEAAVASGAVVFFLKLHIDMVSRTCEMGQPNHLPFRVKVSKTICDCILTVCGGGFCTSDRYQLHENTPNWNFKYVHMLSWFSRTLLLVVVNTNMTGHFTFLDTIIVLQFAAEKSYRSS